MKTIHSKVSGHTLHVAAIARDALPAAVLKNESSANYQQWYVVKNWDAGGVVFMYLAKGSQLAPREVCAFYPNGAFWSSFGNNIQEAIEGAQRDGWLYTYAREST